VLLDEELALRRTASFARPSRYLSVVVSAEETSLSEGHALPPATHPMWGGRDTVFLGAVVPKGATQSVEVVLDGREGQLHDGAEPTFWGHRQKP
jgi:hypothetical protein